jgi:hypothetical protein
MGTMDWLVGPYALDSFVLPSRFEPSRFGSKVMVRPAQFRDGFLMRLNVRPLLSGDLPRQRLGS